MYNTVNLTIFSLLLLLLGLNPLFATEITTTVDRSKIGMGESFQITFTATKTPDGDPNFAPLNVDFDILNQSRRSNSSWINGRSTKTIQWIVMAMPKRTESGKLLIPVIKFGDDISQPAHVVVSSSRKGQQSDESDESELFLKVEATPKSSYVQSQILYTLRLFRNVQLTQASLAAPVMADALVEKLGDDKNYQTDVNGKTYRVTERRYAIFPQKSGQATIEPLVLIADIANTQRSRFNGFFSNQVTRTKRVRSEAITIDVKAPPSSFKDKQWLPAEQVYVEEKWSGDVDNMKVGEPLTRTLTLLVKGSTVAQLPELHKDPSNKQLKTYPDQPVLQEQKKLSGIVALREEKIAYIPSQAGTYTLAAIEIPWFNTQTQHMEIARIPKKIITAMGAAITPNTPQATTPTPIEAAQIEIPADTVDNKFWMWVSIALAFGWLISLLILLKRKPTKPTHKVDEKTPKLNDAVNLLKTACKENDPVAAKNALLTWGIIKLNATNLSTIASYSAAPLNAEIHSLSHHLYAKQPQEWQGKALFQLFSKNDMSDKSAKHIDNKLEALNKISN